MNIKQEIKFAIWLGVIFFIFYVFGADKTILAVSAILIGFLHDISQNARKSQERSNTKEYEHNGSQIPRMRNPPPPPPKKSTEKEQNKSCEGKDSRHCKKCGDGISEKIDAKVDWCYECIMNKTT